MSVGALNLWRINTIAGGRFRLLAIVDTFSRERLPIDGLESMSLDQRSEAGHQPP
jgi:hypothetical protein